MNNQREIAIDLIEYLMEHDFEKKESYYRITGMVMMAYKLGAITEEEKEEYFDKASEILRKL